MPNNYRTATVRGNATREQVERYLPNNYAARYREDGTLEIVGHDHAGWTLDGYVLPRLASGRIWAVEDV